MKLMVKESCFVSILFLTGCISPFASLEGVDSGLGNSSGIIDDTEDTEDPVDDTEQPTDTEDSADTDTNTPNDTDTNQPTDEYNSQQGMEGQYLLMKDDLYLANPPEDDVNLNDQTNFLNFEETWSFGFSLVPNDPLAETLWFGNAQEASKEVAVWSVNNNVLTLQFQAEANDPNMGLLYPVVRLYSRNANTGASTVRELKGTEGARQAFARDELLEGFKVVGSYTPNLNASTDQFVLWVNGFSTDVPTILSEFDTLFNFTPFEGGHNTYFGYNPDVLDSSGTQQVTEKIRGRVDNVFVGYPDDSGMVALQEYFEDPIGELDCDLSNDARDCHMLWTMDRGGDNSNLLQDRSQFEPANGSPSFRVRRGIDLENSTDVSPTELNSTYLFTADN